MKNLLILLVFLPVISFSQLSISAGLLATGSETGIMYSGSAIVKNDRLYFGAKFGTSEIKEARFNYFQLSIGPHFGPFQIGVTFDQFFGSYENIRIERQGIGIRLAGYFRLSGSFGVTAEVNPGIDGHGGKRLQALAGLFYDFGSKN